MRTKKMLAGAGIALGTLVVSTLLHASGFLWESQKVLSHGLYHERETREEIVIVAMDDKSRAEPEEGGLGAKTFWPRTYYSQVIEAIEKGEPALVMLDVLMSSESSSLTEGDLEDLLKNYPNVTTFTENILLFLGTPHPHDSEFAVTLEEYENIYLVKSYYGNPEWNKRARIFLVDFYFYEYLLSEVFANISPA